MASPFQDKTVASTSTESLSLFKSQTINFLVYLHNIPYISLYDYVPDPANPTELKPIFVGRTRPGIGKMEQFACHIQ